MKYVANRDLSFVKAGKKFTEDDVPEGVSLSALLLGRIVQVAVTATEKPANAPEGDE